LSTEHEPGDPAGAGRGIREFWQWWEREGAALASRAASGATTELDPLTTHVAAIHPDLQWEFSAGAQTAHLLVVTAAGDPGLRAVARAWLDAAPEPDVTWGFADLRQPLPDPGDEVIEFGGHRLAFADFVAAAHRGSTSIDVAVHHPVFLDIAEDDAAGLAYLALDSFLGEELTETWIGAVTWPGEPPLDAFPLRFLGSVVRDFAAEHRDDDGNPSWMALQGTGPTGKPVLALAQVPLRQITFPGFDTHLAITIPYAEPTPDGLPTPAGLAHLREREEQLTVVLGAQGRIVAHQSHDGVRLVHAYAAPDPAIAARVAEVAAAWPGSQVVVTADPGWALVNHLAG
jgi:hypothetical protein